MVIANIDFFLPPYEETDKTWHPVCELNEMQLLNYAPNCHCMYWYCNYINLISLERVEYTICLPSCTSTTAWTFAWTFLNTAIFT